tara:strand:- start:603 stop:1316 length:714 start_codon:yes stop_codon:yes gene_type:complete
MVKLVHYKNSLMFSEVINCCAIELKFKGKMIGESKMDESWYIATGANKIVCISTSGNHNVSELFEFEGEFAIVGTKILTKDLDEIPCLYEKLDVDYFGVSKSVFSTAKSYFSDYSSEHVPIDSVDNIDIYRNNLFTKQDEFYFENGDKYFGEYHQHSNGQAMTGSEHNKDSVDIYRKDQNDILYKPKSKKLRKTKISEQILIERVDFKKHSKGITRAGDSTDDASGGSHAGGGGASY